MIRQDENTFWSSKVKKIRYSCNTQNSVERMGWKDEKDKVVAVRQGFRVNRRIYVR